MSANETVSSPGAAVAGRFGVYGGRYVPETLMAALEELEAAYAVAKEDPAFQAELNDLLHHYCGRPTPLYFAKRLSDQLGGAKIYLKREDLLHTGAHKPDAPWSLKTPPGSAEFQAWRDPRAGPTRAGGAGRQDAIALPASLHRRFAQNAEITW